MALGDLALKTGQLTETVTVQSEGQIVEKESSDLTARLTADQIMGRTSLDPRWPLPCRADTPLDFQSAAERVKQMGREKK